MKIFAQFVSSLFGSILLGIVGLFIGAYIGSNFDFPEFGLPEFGDIAYHDGNAGYESGVVFFTIVGISIGSLLGIMTAKKLQKEVQENLSTLIVIAVIMVIMGIILFDYNMPLAIGLIIFLMPSIVLTLIANRRKFSGAKNS